MTEAGEPIQAGGANRNLLERLLFPRSKFVQFLVIVSLSIGFSLALTGREIYEANWGLVDDHEIFYLLGSGLHLSPGDIWNTFLTKTEMATSEPRFRPSYYLIRLAEISLFGTNVHLWYLVNTACFAIFLSSAWWTLRRFLGGWLSGVLTISIAMLSLWADIWSRLGPQEIYGAAFVGVMLLAADLILSCEGPRPRSLGAIMLALATIVLVGMKETFLPFAGGAVIIFTLAAIRKRLHPLLIGVLSAIMLTCVGGIVFEIGKRILAGGMTDFYGRPAGPWPIIKFGIAGLFDAVLMTWWLYVLPFVFLRIFDLVPRKPLRGWISDSSGAVGAYVFLLAMFAAQCALYRAFFPQNMRYDFPAMLLVPVTICIIACEISRQARKHFPELTIEYGQLTTAVFLLFALVIGNLSDVPLVRSVQANIKRTNLFYDELQRLVSAAKESPESPVILEAFGPLAQEPVLSLAQYLSVLGVGNRISVDFHRDENAKGAAMAGLQQSLVDLQMNGNGRFTPLKEALVAPIKEPLNVCIGVLPTASCGFHIPDLRIN